MDCFVASLLAMTTRRNDRAFNSEQFATGASASDLRLHMRSSLDVHDCPAKRTRMSEHAHTVKTRVAAISIFASAAMAAAKFVVGILIGSLALVSEPLHSSVDVVATVIPWMVVRVSDQPADEEHHYGHGKFESVSALFVIAILYVLAGGILVESWSRLREGTPPPAIAAIPFVVLVIDIAVNFWRARALHRTARETRSEALAADALHFASDVLGSIAVIIGLALAGLGFWWGDAAAAIAVAIMIAALGLRMARATVEPLLDRAPPPRADWATKERVVEAVRASWSRATSGLTSTNWSKPHSGGRAGIADCTSNGVSPVR